jgi:hypothetical protein
MYVLSRAIFSVHKLKFSPIQDCLNMAWIIANRLGKELDLETVADLAKVLTINNYLTVRRDPTTINRKEFSKILLERLNLNYSEEGKLTRETVFR